MVKHVKYHCTHCGRRFEAQEREVIECPGCYWSTSVRRDDEREPREIGLKRTPVRKTAAKKEGGQNRPSVFPGIFKTAFVFLAVLSIGAVGYFVLKIEAVQNLPQTLRSLLSAVVPAEREAAKWAGPAKEEGHQPQAGQTDEEAKRILERRTDVSPTPVLSPEGEKILKQTVPFRTGFVRKLPSEPWTVENLEEMIQEQEQFYKLSFPRSYRKRVIDHFTVEYPAAVQAFERGDLLEARNRWIALLAFPRYSEDLRRHRGVALTILRPLITDTLSKIGALNGMLMEESLRSREKSIDQRYQETLRLIERQIWGDALRAMTDLEQDIAALERAAAEEKGAPAYPPQTAQVDTDIQKTLYDLLEMPAPPITDFGPMRRDLRAKKEVIESLIPENHAEQIAFYEDAMEKIRKEKWSEARRSLEKIRFPESLAKDAKEKIQVLRRLETLDSSVKSR